MGGMSFLLGGVSSLLLGVSCSSGGVSLCRRSGGLEESLSFLLGGRVVFSSRGILRFWCGILCRRPGGLVDSLFFFEGVVSSGGVSLYSGLSFWLSCDFLG